MPIASLLIFLVEFNTKLRLYMHVGTSRFRHAMQLQFFRFTPQSAEPNKTPQYGTWLYQSYIRQVYADQNQTKINCSLHKNLNETTVKYWRKQRKNILWNFFFLNLWLKHGLTINAKWNLNAFYLSLVLSTVSWTFPFWFTVFTFFTQLSHKCSYNLRSSFCAREKEKGCLNYGQEKCW